MKLKYFLVFSVILLTAFSILVMAAPKWKQTCPIKADTNVVFYGETGFGGVGAPSKSWMIHFLDWWQQQDSSVNYVELSSSDVISKCDLSSFPSLKLYIQPGGDAYYMQNKLGSEGKNNILSYLNSGGSYFGACAGWYYTANDYVWQGEYYNHPDMLDFYPATVEGSITSIADYEGNPDHKVTSLSTGFNAIYYGGPTIGWQNTQGPAPGTTEATFTDISGDLPAVVKYNNALLTSVHLEAYENDGITGLTTEDRIENYKYLGNLLNEVAGTNFYVPAYTNPPVCGNDVKESGEICDGIDFNGESCQTLGFDEGTLSCLTDCSGFDTSSCIDNPPQCSDGLDNDGDFLVDYPNDPGCSDANDEDETDVIGPIELLNDNFEDGNLVEWTLSGSGRVWSASTDTPYQGSWSARAKQTGAGSNSYMEISIDGSSYNSLTFEYYRKLVGLDGADNFEVAYFDGGWNNLEALGSSSENNANYVFKNFQIPNTATKIRFMCECGAVSEKCYVDNVKVIGE